MEKCLIFVSSITSQFRSFFHWIVFNLFFLLRDSENDLLLEHRNVSHSVSICNGFVKSQRIFSQRKSCTTSFPNRVKNSVKNKAFYLSIEVFRFFFISIFQQQFFFKKYSFSKVNSWHPPISFHWVWGMNTFHQLTADFERIMEETYPFLLKKGFDFGWHKQSFINIFNFLLTHRTFFFIFILQQPLFETSFQR